MRRPRSFPGLLLCFACITFLSGCGGGDDTPTLHQLNGTVTHNGKPVVTLMQPNPNPDTPPLTPEMRALFEKYGEGKSSLNITVDSDKNDFELVLD